MKVDPIGKNFVAQLTGLRANGALCDADVDHIHGLMECYAVLILPGQDITDDEQVAFTERLGPLEPAVGNNVTPQAERRLSAAFSDVSNLDGAGAVFDRADRGRLFGFGNRLWHTDASFRAVPAKYSILSARAVPSHGGNTEFADMRAAYEALDERTKDEIRPLVAEHSLLFSRELLGFSEYSQSERAAFTPVRQAMVREVKPGGRKSLYVASHAGSIVGWPRPEARAFIFDLIDHATRPEFVHVHEWTRHDLVIWDNRQTMHRVRRFDDTTARRDMRRTTVRGDGPTTPQESR
ncbi:MAG: TauD/TfdA family dioxygenase [Pseudomonadota bacterium]